MVLTAKKQQRGRGIELCGMQGQGGDARGVGEEEQDGTMGNREDDSEQ